ncbi:unnamed protein product [Microthlaspi erraticum]|uniref:F-box domain-containing protein n=1 Tax=Microthlaspi erraticum TaxID=1685480 RepID=A0A6D2IWA9_9BRAS|nr:unnamed protein product [Microthlaspi erraticum]
MMKRLSKTKIPELPWDLVEDILCRVPAKSVTRFRSTCKQWNRLIKDKDFARKHSGKAQTQFLALVLTHDFNIHPLSINLHGTTPSVEVKNEHLSLPDPHSINVSAHFQVFRCADGFLLCTSKDERRILVWNPCTSQTIWIEVGDRCKHGRHFILGYHQENRYSEKIYKILSFTPGCRNWEIYDFSSDSWRFLKKDIAPGWEFGHLNNHGVSLKGKIYCFATRLYEYQRGSIFLLRFDFSTGKASSEHVEPLPYLHPYHRYRTLNLSVVRDEKISLLLETYDTPKTEIWVTGKIGENKRASWNKVLAFDLAYSFISGFDSFLLDEVKKVAVCCERTHDVEDLPIHNVVELTIHIDKIHIVEEDDRFTTMDIGTGEDPADLCLPVIIHFVPSLAQIELVGGGKTRNRLKM